ncbi:MAG: glycerophosphoryl diester phosphodiesterase, partial [Candidatus Saccharibacteria bacterium]|nr:glycerophosphoryl diester phosphodiesterase [Candidatus Saccharibacteria bacterium]
MTKIVGHRGASGQELENTIRSFKLAKELGVDAIELDILATKDGKIVVCHDNDLKRLSGQQLCISDITYQELAEIHLHNGETIPLLY